MLSDDTSQGARGNTCIITEKSVDFKEVQQLSIRDVSPFFVNPTEFRIAWIAYGAVTPTTAPVTPAAIVPAMIASLFFSSAASVVLQKSI